jgi:hypothetical protein
VGLVRMLMIESVRHGCRKNYYRLKFRAAFSKYFAHVFFNCPVSMGSINLNKPDVLMVT